MQLRQDRRWHRMRMGLDQRNQRNSTETLRTENAALATAGIVLGTGGLYCFGRVRHIPVVAVMASVNRLGSAGLDRHSQGRQGGRPGQRRRQQHGNDARISSLTWHQHTLPDMTRDEKSANPLTLVQKSAGKLRLRLAVFHRCLGYRFRRQLERPAGRAVRTNENSHPPERPALMCHNNANLSV